MTKYIIRRFFQAIPLVLLFTAVVFALMQLMPGGPLAVYEGNPNLTPEDLERLKRELGLDAPIYVQYFNWLKNIAMGDWGTSLVTKRPVMDEILERLPNTLTLSLTAFVVSLLVAIPIGIYSASRPYSRFDAIATTMAFIGQAMPIFWFGLILIIVFNVTLRNPITDASLLPSGGMRTIGAPFSYSDRIWHLLLPAFTLAFFNLGTHVRFMRAGMLDVLKQDYVRTARAKGLTERWVVAKHALRNALLPLVTIIGLELPGLINGALITETVFAWPGMGRLFFTTGIERGDFPLMMAMLLVSCLMVVISGLLTDIAYAWLDPRIRF
ncbi:MAG: ABC transporter permease [Anaerolineae bacterium]|nr:ABC transporter permease [Anaerolineae bacterium]